MTETALPEPKPAPSSGGWGRFVPVALFAAMAAVFYFMLSQSQSSACYKSKDLPSALVGRPVPQFALPSLDGLRKDGGAVPGFSDADLKKGQLTIVNVFASWCGPCRVEHPFIMELAADPRVRVVGINQRDKPEDAKRFLADLGNPYSAIGVDANGRVSIDWGVYGVPETFVVRGDGSIAFKKVGPISAECLKDEILPAIKKALE
jgi:cytochrome c biogenesis protein CcmG, thiol:disulfide interchange protein DsbE